MSQKFDRIRLKLWIFLPQVKFYLRLHPSQYFDGFTQVGFISALLSRNVLSRLVPFIEKDSQLFYNLNSFFEIFMATFGKSDL